VRVFEVLWVLIAKIFFYPYVMMSSLIVHADTLEDPLVLIVFVVEGLCSCEMFWVCKHKVRSLHIEVS
jgi:hypothetical protein